MERFKLMRLQSIWGNRCNSEPYQKWLFLPLNQRAVGSTPTRAHHLFLSCSQQLLNWADPASFLAYTSSSVIPAKREGAVIYGSPFLSWKGRPREIPIQFCFGMPQA